MCCVYIQHKSNLIYQVVFILKSSSFFLLLFSVCDETKQKKDFSIVRILKQGKNDVIATDGCLRHFCQHRVSFCASATSVSMGQLQLSDGDSFCQYRNMLLSAWGQLLSAWGHIKNDLVLFSSVRGPHVR